MSVDLLVQRKGLDPTAATCEHALRNIMQVPVDGVEHGTLWRFDIDVPGNGSDASRGHEVRRLLERAAARAGRYVNLNRDRMTWIGDPSTCDDAFVDSLAGCCAHVWVRSRPGDDPEALAWFRKHTGLALRAVQRGPLYRLHVQVDDESEARRWASDIASSRSRRHGLLANPHLQKTAILGVHRCAPAPGGNAA